MNLHGNSAIFFCTNKNFTTLIYMDVIALCQANVFVCLFNNDNFMAVMNSEYHLYVSSGCLSSDSHVLNGQARGIENRYFLIGQTALSFPGDHVPQPPNDLVRL